MYMFNKFWLLTKKYKYGIYNIYININVKNLIFFAKLVKKWTNNQYKGIRGHIKTKSWFKIFE